MKTKPHDLPRRRPGVEPLTQETSTGRKTERHARLSAKMASAKGPDMARESNLAKDATAARESDVPGQSDGVRQSETPRQSVAFAEPVMRSLPAEPSDETLLGLYLHGDRASFAKLIERYQRELFHFLIRFLGDRATAEDIFQETFLQVHQSAAMFDRTRRFRPWLFTIAANKARDFHRAQSRRPTSPLQAPISSDESTGEFIDLMAAAQEMPDEPMQKQELRDSVRKAVMAMPEHLREIILLSYFQQFPYNQISEILGIPLGTVKSRLHAAVAFFAAKWNAANPDKGLA